MRLNASTNMGKDYYKVLNIDKSASADEVKKAFRKLAHQYHPDKEGGDEAKFKEVNEAYQVLSNEKKRQQYDQFGKTFEGAGGQYSQMNWDDFMSQFGDIFSGGFGARSAGSGQGFNVGGFDIGDIFSGFGGRSTRVNNRGRDMEVSLDLDFKEAVAGVEKTIKLDKLDTCDKCSGSGAEAGTKIIKCPQCDGQGQVVQMQRTILGSIQQAAICPTCHGKGEKPEQFCKKCHGEGRTKQAKSIKIKVPAGIDQGQAIRLTGQGEAGQQGAQAGDLYVSFRVKSDSQFIRAGYDVRAQVSIPFTLAALGGKVAVPSLNGKLELKIPAGTQPGQVFKMSGKGISHLGNEHKHGDQLVEVKVEVPKKLSRKQKKLLEELNES
jgi:molecular chaperone DnaJ